MFFVFHENHVHTEFQFSCNRAFPLSVERSHLLEQRKLIPNYHRLRLVATPAWDNDQYRDVMRKHLKSCLSITNDVTN